MRKIEIVKEVSEDTINRYDEFFNHPVRELEVILSQTHNMSIISLLYKIEELYKNTSDIHSFMINVKLNKTDTERLSLEQNQNHNMSLFDNSVSEKRVEFRQVRNGLTTPVSIEDASLYLLEPYLTYENHFIINKYFKKIENKKDRFEQYRSIIEDYNLLGTEDLVEKWENGSSEKLKEDAEAVERVVIDNDKVFSKVFGALSRNYIMQNHLYINEKNVENWLNNSLKELRKQAIILYVEDLIYHQNMTLSLSSIALNGQMYLSHKIEKNEELTPEEKRMSNILTLLCSAPIEKVNYNQAMIVPYKEKPYGEKQYFFEDYNTFTVNKNNLYKDFIKPYVEIVFSYYAMQNKVLHNCEINSDRANLKESIVVKQNVNKATRI